MKTNIDKFYKRVSLFLLAIIAPSLSFAESFSVSEQTQGGNASLYAEIAIGIGFVGAVVAFLIWKSKHDKKMREKQLEQMRKVQAAKRRAA